MEQKTAASLAPKSTGSSSSWGCSILLFLLLLYALIAGVRALFLRSDTIAVLPPRSAGCREWSRWNPQITGLAYTPDGATLIVVGEGLAAYDAVNQRPLWCVDAADPEYFFGIWAVSPDGKTIATLNRLSVLETRRVADGALLQQWTTPISYPFSSDLTFTPDGRGLVLPGNDRQILLWSLGGIDNPRVLVESTASVESVAFSPDGQTLAVVTIDNAIALWNTITWTVEKTWVNERFSTTPQLVFSPDGQTLALWGGEGVSVLRLRDGAIWLHWMGLENNFKYVNDLAFSPDGRYMAAVAHGSAPGRSGRTAFPPRSWDTLALWETTSWQQVAEDSGGWTVAFTPDNTAVLVDAGRGVREIPLSELLKK